MHLANFCFPDERFEAELAQLADDILANSWYANQVNKRALIDIDGLSLHECAWAGAVQERGTGAGCGEAGGRLFRSAKGRRTLAPPWGSTLAQVARSRRVPCQPEL